MQRDMRVHHPGTKKQHCAVELGVLNPKFFFITMKITKHTKEERNSNSHLNFSCISCISWFLLRISGLDRIRGKAPKILRLLCFFVAHEIVRVPELEAQKNSALL
jgi:hypothetical protein